jgi:RNA polymerase sporulation-specific sigma factor
MIEDRDMPMTWAGEGMAEPGESALLRRAAQDDGQAIEQILIRYKGLVRHKASLMFMAGADAEDVIQEGMIGLFKAIRAFNPAKQVPFAAFASYCIMAQITDAVRRASRRKHELLNQSVSLQSLIQPTEEDGGTLTDQMASLGGHDPEQALLNQENLQDLLLFIRQDLSTLERRSVLLFIQNLSYQQIAACLDIPVKTVDNALRRARKKFMIYRQAQMRFAGDKE